MQAATIYNALVVSVLLYRAETWTLTNSDEQKQARILPDVLLTTDSWNTLVRLCTKRVSNEPDLATKHPQQNPRQANLSIGHVRRLQESVPAHEALLLVVGH